MVKKAKRPSLLFRPENRKIQSKEQGEKMLRHFELKNSADAIIAFCVGAGLAGSRHCKWLRGMAEKAEGEINILDLYERSLTLALEEEGSEGIGTFMTPITYQRIGYIESLIWVTGVSGTEIKLTLGSVEDPRSFLSVMNDNTKKYQNAEGQWVDPKRSLVERTAAIYNFLVVKNHHEAY